VDHSCDHLLNWPGGLHQNRRLTGLAPLTAATGFDNTRVYIAVGMNSSETSSSSKKRCFLQNLLKGIALTFGVAAGFSFWVGGRAIHEMTQTDRLLAEMEGIALAVVFALLAVLLKGLAERIEDPDYGETVSLAIGKTSEGEE